MTAITLEGESFEIEGSDGDRYADAILAARGDFDFLASAFAELQPDGSLALDVGANIGLTALLMARLRSGGDVLAIEPSASTFAHLERNLRVNAGNVSALRTAVGAATGERGWVDDVTNSAASHLSPEGSPAGMVSVTTLDDLVTARALSPTFIKLDVEGSELDVLEGGRRTLRNHRPVLFVELNSFTAIAYGGRSPRALLDFLLEHFAHVYWFSRGGLTELRSEQSVLDLLHMQLTTGSCVNDLLCIPSDRDFDAARLAARLKPVVEPPDPRDVLILEQQARLHALQVEHSAVLDSRTWRLAIGLRRALARVGL